MKEQEPIKKDGSIASLIFGIIAIGVTIWLLTSI